MQRGLIALDAMTDSQKNRARQNQQDAQNPATGQNENGTYYNKWNTHQMEGFVDRMPVVRRVTVDVFLETQSEPP